MFQMYEKMYKRVTPNGVTVDKCIQPSVDFTGKIVGLVAGDEQSYTVWNSLKGRVQTTFFFLLFFNYKLFCG